MRERAYIWLTDQDKRNAMSPEGRALSLSMEGGPATCVSEQIRAGDSLLGAQLPSQVTGKGRNEPRGMRKQ